MGPFFHGHHFPVFGMTWHICHTIMFVLIALIVGFLLWKFGQFLAQEWVAYRERKWQLKDAYNKQISILNEKLLDLKRKEYEADKEKLSDYEQALAKYKEELKPKKK